MLSTQVRPSVTSFRRKTEPLSLVECGLFKNMAIVYAYKLQKPCHRAEAVNPLHLVVFWSVWSQTFTLSGASRMRHNDELPENECSRGLNCPVPPPPFLPNTLSPGVGKKGSANAIYVGNVFAPIVDDRRSIRAVERLWTFD